MHPSWNAIHALLEGQGGTALFDLNPPASASSIRALEEHIGVSLPLSLRDLLVLHDGQGRGHRCGLFFGDEFLSVEGIRAHWDNWKSLEDEGLNAQFADQMSSKPPGAVKPLYHNPKWIPFTHDGGGNHSGVDFDPAAQGHAGQVIAFGRDLDEKCLLAGSFDGFLERFHQHLLTVPWSLSKGWWAFGEDRFKRHYQGWFGA